MKGVPVGDGVVDGGDDVADEAFAGRVEHFFDKQRCPGCDALAASAGVVPAAGDDAGDVRAVTVVVVGLGLEVDEVRELHDASGPEVVVEGGDARVDDGDANACAVHAKGLVDPAGADRRARSFKRALDRSIEADTPDAWHRGQRIERLVAHIGDLAAQQRKPSADDTIHGANQARRRNAGFDGQDDPGMAGRRMGAPSQRRVEARVPRVGRAARGCRGGCHETRNGQEERSNHLEQSGGNRRQTAPELQSDCPSRRSGRRLLTVLIPGLYRWKPRADSFRPCAVCQRSVLFQNNNIQK